MCGIFGMFSKKTKPFNKRAFCTMGVRNDSRGGDSCGVFIDGQVEYGVDKQKTFISFFRDSNILNNTTECKVALGHCRKASVGKISIETAQPVVLYNEAGEVDYVLIHNGTIYNYKELAQKYIPDVNIEGLTDSQVMARIFYHKGYDMLDEYIGGAVFVIHDYRIGRSLIFKGSSKKYTTSKEPEEERPLYYCWHNGRFVFSSIFETLYAFYYEEIVYTLAPNRLYTIKSDRLKLVKEYKREQVTQCKPVTPVTTYPAYVWDDDDDYYKGYHKHNNPNYKPNEMTSYLVTYDGLNYIDKNKAPMHGIYFVSSYGYVFPNKTTKENWLNEVGFFLGKMLKCPQAFKLLNDKYQKANKVVTREIEILMNMLDFNPYTEDLYQFYWFDGTDCMIPQGEWKFPMANWSYVFDKDGQVLEQGKKPYHGWTTDYNMYTYEEEKILEALKKLCKEDKMLESLKK